MKVTSIMNQTMRICTVLLFVIMLLSVVQANEQNRRHDRSSGQSELNQSMPELDTPDFTLKLVKDSQTVAALEPKGGEGFDFTSADQLERRSADV